VRHHDGLTQFLEGVLRLPQPLPADSRFGKAIIELNDPLTAFDNRFGHYRDKFVVHLPVHLSRGGHEAITLAREFYVTHSRNATDVELQDLRNALGQVLSHEAIGLDVNFRDPRLVLEDVNERLREISSKQGADTIKKLVRVWGTRSPNVADVVVELVALLRRWIGVLEAVATLPPS
jgi:hypothetical protein